MSNYDYYDNYEDNNRNNNNNNRGGKYAPDHGKLVLGETAEYAPKSLDHFKRGYHERAEMRERENYSQKNGPTGKEKPRDRDPWSYRDRPTILQGLDINALVDRLSDFTHNRHLLFVELDKTREANRDIFDSGKACTALISVSARRKNIVLGQAIWDWMDVKGLQKNTFHYNSMISVTEKARDHRRALALLKEMSEKRIPKNEVTFSSAISACEKCGEWKTAIDLLNSMEGEGVTKTAIAYNATISACEKGMVPQKACEIFQRMKREGVRPSVVSYSALISAAEKGGQWKLALEILDEMKHEGFVGNVVAYSAAISALAKGQQWRKALQLFKEIRSHGGMPSIVTYNATMTALEKGMQWERALGLFEEMKMNNLPITVVSYGSAISACDKGFQYRQCLEYLDEMTEMGIPKNVIIFGAAMSCMEKCSRADIGFQLMKRMKEEGIAPNVHIYNSAISACARSNLWEKGYELFQEMDRVGVRKDVVTYNAVLDAVASQIRLGRTLFEEGVEKGFYAKVSRLGEHWFELDLHFMSLGGGEIACGWWFEECLVPYLQDTGKLKNVKSISIVTGFGKTRTRGRRHGDDGMRKRIKAMLRYMNIGELESDNNPGRIHVDKESLITEVNKNGGKVDFDLAGYIHWKERETTANVIPDTPQKIRARFKPVVPGSGRPPFQRIENDNTTEEYRLVNQRKRTAAGYDDIYDDEGDYRADIDYASRDKTRFENPIQSSYQTPHENSRQGMGGGLGHYGPSGSGPRNVEGFERGRNSNPKTEQQESRGAFHNIRSEDRGGRAHYQGGRDRRDIGQERFSQGRSGNQYAPTPNNRRGGFSNVRRSGPGREETFPQRRSDQLNSGPQYNNDSRFEDGPSSQYGNDGPSPRYGDEHFNDSHYGSGAGGRTDDQYMGQQQNYDVGQRQSNYGGGNYSGSNDPNQYPDEHEPHSDEQYGSRGGYDDRKRGYEEYPPPDRYEKNPTRGTRAPYHQSEMEGTERRSSTASSRGYTLEPPAQRRRMS